MQPLTVSVLAFVVSCLSLLVSAGSLMWNMYSFRSQGPRISVVTGGSQSEADEIEPGELLDANESILCLTVRITNYGRAAVDIDQIWFEPVPRGDGDPLAWGARSRKGAKLPARLEAHSTLNWDYNFVEMGRDHLLHDSAGQPKSIRVWVTLGNGQEVRSKPDKHEWLHDRLPPRQRRADLE